MSTPPNASRPRPWLRPQFSLGTLFWLMVMAGLAAVWWKDRSRLEQRIARLEQMTSPAQQTLWGAADILGPPDDPTGGAGKSWCPARSTGTDWVEVAFDKSVAAATIDLYETYSVGCVTEVFVVDGSGRETSIWKGTDPTPPTLRTGLFRVPVPKSIQSVQRVKIHVDSSTKGSWACIDAVGLTTAAGKTVWASSSAASTVYGGGSLTASAEQDPWYAIW
jgi:hypothetical protein